MSKETESGAAGTDQPVSTSAAEAPTRREPLAGSRENRPKKKKKRPKPPVFRNEDEIASPGRLTMGLLGAVMLVTIVLWGFARGACNYHPPRESRRPRVVKTEELMRDPKSSAVELWQRLGAANFKGAAELATGSAVAEIEKERAACEADAARCANRRKQADQVVTTAALLERDMNTATVRVNAVRPSSKQTLLVEVKHDGPVWKVSSWAPDTGQFKPRPVSSASVPFVVPPQKPPSGGAPQGTTGVEHKVPKTDPPEARP
jgi:hypothetical protein